VKDFNDDNPGEASIGQNNLATTPTIYVYAVTWRDRATQRKGVDTPRCLAAAWRANHQPEG